MAQKKRMQNKGFLLLVCFLNASFSGMLFGMEAGPAGMMDFALTKDDEHAVRNLHGALAAITCGNAVKTKDSLIARIQDSSEQIGYLQRRLFPKPDNALIQNAEPRAVAAMQQMLAACRATLEKLAEVVNKVSDGNVNMRVQAHAREVFFNVQDVLAEFFAICMQQHVPADSLRVIAQELADKRKTFDVCPTPQDYFQKYVPADSLLLLCADLMMHYTADLKKKMMPCQTCAQYCDPSVWCTDCKRKKQEADKKYRDATLSSGDVFFETFRPDDQLRYLDVRIGAVAQEIDEQVKMHLGSERQKECGVQQPVDGEGSADGRQKATQAMAADAAAGGAGTAQKSDQQTVPYETLVSTLVLSRQFLACKPQCASILTGISKNFVPSVRQLLSVGSSANIAGSWAKTSLATTLVTLGGLLGDSAVKQLGSLLPKGMTPAAVIAFVNDPMVRPLLENYDQNIANACASLASITAIGEPFCTDMGQLLALSNRERTLGKSLSAYTQELGETWQNPRVTISRPLSDKETQTEGPVVVVPSIAFITNTGAEQR